MRTGVLLMAHGSPESIDQMLEQSDEAFERMVRLLSPADDPEAWSRQRDDLVQAFQLLAVHVAGLGLSPAMRARSRPSHIEVQVSQSGKKLVPRVSGAAVKVFEGTIRI